MVVLTNLQRDWKKKKPFKAFYFFFVLKSVFSFHRCCYIVVGPFSQWTIIQFQFSKRQKKTLTPKTKREKKAHKPKCKWKHKNYSQLKKFIVFDLCNKQTFHLFYLAWWFCLKLCLWLRHLLSTAVCMRSLCVKRASDWPASVSANKQAIGRLVSSRERPILRLRRRKLKKKNTRYKTVLKHCIDSHSVCRGLSTRMANLIHPFYIRYFYCIFIPFNFNSITTELIGWSERGCHHIIMIRWA